MKEAGLQNELKKEFQLERLIFFRDAVFAIRVFIKQFLIPILFVLTVSLSAFSQENNGWLITKIKMADTILLVSHKATAGVQMIDNNGNSVPLPELTIANRPNYKILKEQQIIKDKLLDTLIQILAKPFRDSKIVSAGCFIPHQAIFLIKNGQASYIDICFHCRGFETSADLKQLNAFDMQKWDELENFFSSLGFRYKLMDLHEKN